MEAEQMAGFAKRKMLNESLESWGKRTFDQVDQRPFCRTLRNSGFVGLLGISGSSFTAPQRPISRHSRHYCLVRDRSNRDIHFGCKR